MNQGTVNNLNNAYAALQVDMVAFGQLPPHLEVVLRGEFENWVNAKQVVIDLEEMKSKDGLLTSVLEHLDLPRDPTSESTFDKAIEEAKKMAAFCCTRANNAKAFILDNSLGHMLFLVNIFNKYAKAKEVQEYYTAMHACLFGKMSDPEYLARIAESIKELGIKTPVDADDLVNSFNLKSKDFSYLKLLSASHLEVFSSVIRTCAARLGVEEIEEEDFTNQPAEGA